MLFNEAMAERGRLEAHCQQLSAKLIQSEHQAMMSQNGAINNNRELQEQQRKIITLNGENVSMARQNSEHEMLIAQCRGELGACKSEEMAYQKASCTLQEEVENERAQAEAWRECAGESQSSLREVWTEFDEMKKKFDEASENQRRETPFPWRALSPCRSGHRRG